MEQKGGERNLKKEEKEEEEFLGINLKFTRSTRISTPSLPWNFHSSNPNSSSLSARQLAANLRQIHPTLHNMDHGAPPPTNHRQKDKSFQPHRVTHQPASATTLKRFLAASLVQNHRSVHRTTHLPHLQTVSPASYATSSFEVAPYNPSITATSSMDSKGRIGEENYNVKSSNELLKVLDRIWTLEEQHASNSSLVMKMKKELHNSQAQIKELLQEKQKTVQSMRKEIEDERKLRKHSESIHRKIARELLDVKYSYLNALKERENERKARIVLENLCDEFAYEIRDYEQEIRTMKQNPNKERVVTEKPERLILHLSESWLDERMQMNLGDSQSDSVEKNTIVDKLSSEIETFLHSKKSKRHSSESFHLNESISGPQNDNYDEDSSGKQRNTGSKTREHSHQIVIMNPMKKKILNEAKILEKEGNVVDSQGRRLNLTRNQSCSNERSGFSGDDPTVEQWRSNFSNADPEVSECSSRLVKENSLKAKLLEARLEGRYRSRTSKGSFS